MYLSVILKHFYSFIYSFLPPHVPTSDELWLFIRTYGLPMYKKNNKRENLFSFRAGYIYLFILQVHKYVFFFKQLQTIPRSLCWREPFLIKWVHYKKWKKISMEEFLETIFFSGCIFSFYHFSLKVAKNCSVLRKYCYIYASVFVILYLSFILRGLLS